MGGFLLTPVTRFYAEVLQSIRYTGNVLSGTEAGRRTGGADFAGVVSEKLERENEKASGRAEQTGGRKEALIQSMSREEYKLYIYQKIAGIPMNASQKWDAVSVDISEEGFAAMQADSSYEKWVLDTLKNDFSYYNPWSSYCGGSYRVHSFGATKEEYRGESFQMGFRNGGKHTESKKKEKSFWEKRAERHKLYMDLAQKSWYQHENERDYQNNIDLHRRELDSAMLRQWSLERAAGERAELNVNPSVLSEAAADFTQGYVFFKIPSALMNPKTTRGA